MCFGGGEIGDLDRERRFIIQCDSFKYSLKIRVTIFATLQIFKTELLRGSCENNSHDERKCSEK
jgi:hypothetical protein